MLKVKDLSCQKGYNLLFKNLSLQIKSGDILRITGTNGSGKTSLLKILAGISPQESGTITLNESSPKSAKYRENVLYLGHLAALSTSMSTLENCQFLTNLSQSDTPNLIQALAAIGLKGYEHELCSKLSAGQKRRVILASLLVSKAKLWLLDEPFTALDPAGVQIIEKAISDHSQRGGMCVFTTHQPANLPQQQTLSL